MVIPVRFDDSWGLFHAGGWGVGKRGNNRSSKSADATPFLWVTLAPRLPHLFPQLSLLPVSYVN